MATPSTCSTPTPSEKKAAPRASPNTGWLKVSNEEWVMGMCLVAQVSPRCPLPAVAMMARIPNQSCGPPGESDSRDATAITANTTVATGSIDACKVVASKLERNRLARTK